MCKDSKILKEDIEQLLQQITPKRSGKDASGPRLRDEKLLGPKVGMPARELLYVYFDIRQQMGIRISEYDIIEGRFDTFNNILDLIIKEALGLNQSKRERV